ncbi:alpha/beta hydrolase [Streptomyces niveiscabiei]|uniref:RBBP9/YdeN family alpha/beta hydrolase n=1 Tax=Streptomyces niveiscabiei TaxID=164115 RepID=UPI0029BBFF11|nr:alpha/beta hydrolase [Streptomyces niveiscabiei]MDX3383500.1 alpha/beta hydrolase [Streptomyces niveiscabiei]
MTSSFLILHGWQNHRPEGHWQHWLAGRLTDLGHEVVYPQLPDPDHPELDVWLREFERHLTTPPRPRTVIAHSLATVTWLHALARDLPGLDTVDRTLLVSPVTVVTDHPEIAGFALPPLTGLTPPSPTRIVAGDDDPYCPEGAQAAYGDPLGVTAEVLPGAGHLTPDEGYGPWPSVLEWCLDGETRLTAR